MRPKFVKSRYLIFLTALSALLLSCELPKVDKEAPTINEVSANSKFKINLPENHATGYVWQLSPDFDQTVAEEMNAVWHGNEKGIDFNFKSRSSGQTSLTFVLRKHTDTANVKTFLVKIIDK